MAAHHAIDPRAQMFRNRLRKNMRRLRPWAQRNAIEAYRLYDSDIPEVRLIIERYGDHLVVWEYARRADHDPDRDVEQRDAAHDRFLQDVEQALADECGVDRDAIIWKTRQRQRGAQQYQKLDSARREIVIREGGHRFLVNLTDYLDTGLFLDHRGARALVGKLAAGRRVLNLFGYTGSFSVYAAAGGAVETLTIDLSNTYLDWAARNLQLNNLPLAQHRQQREDILAWLRDPRTTAAAAPRYDLIVLDPPTFSNSKKMRDTLDIARDHPWLLSQTLRLLRPGGMMLFSCNHSRFALQREALPNAADLTIRDVGGETLPPDFHNPKTRSCYLITLRASP